MLAAVIFDYYMYVVCWRQRLEERSGEADLLRLVRLPLAQRPQLLRGAGGMIRGIALQSIE